MASRRRVICGCAAPGSHSTVTTSNRIAAGCDRSRLRYQRAARTRWRCFRAVIDSAAVPNCRERRDRTSTKQTVAPSLATTSSSPTGYLRSWPGYRSRVTEGTPRRELRWFDRDVGEASNERGQDDWRPVVGWKLRAVYATARASQATEDEDMSSTSDTAASTVPEDDRFTRQAATG